MTDEKFYNFDDRGLLVEDDYQQELNAETHRENNNKGRRPIKEIQELSKTTGIDEKVLETEARQLKRESGLKDNYAMEMLYVKYMPNHAKTGTSDEV